MHTHRQEVARLFRVALDRPRWQRLPALAVSFWTLFWIGGQFAGTAPSALGVVEDLGALVGLSGGPWADRVSAAWRGVGGWSALAGGLFWAATTERGQGTALLGWIAVMLGAEQLGYRPAILLALAAMVGFAAMLWLMALTRTRFVDRRSTLLPRDVLRAGITAATLSVVVPLYGPMAAAARLGRPYLTHAPKVLSPESGVAGRGGWSRIPEQDRADA